MLTALSLLPFFAFLSLFHKRGHHSEAGFLPFLAALAPVLAKGAMSLVGYKQKQSVEEQAEEQKKLEAAKADAEARHAWELRMQSPEEQARRFKSKFAFGKLAGKMGGMDKVPPSLAAYSKSGYAMP